MTSRRSVHDHDLAAEDDGLPTVIPVTQDGRIISYHRVGQEEPRSEADLPPSTRAALAVIGAWSDLDWDEMEAALDRIRHESPPSPPIDDLEHPNRS